MYRKGQKNEFYTIKAREEGYPARSVYKLKEIDEKFKVIASGDKVLDLGSAPGSWMIYLSNKVGSTGMVVGLDLEDVVIEKRQNMVFYKRDILSLTPKDLQEIGAPFNAIVADLAPKTSGVPSIDAGKSLELCEMAFDIAKKSLREGGVFLTKIFESEDTKEFTENIRKNFTEVRRIKPQAVMKQSREFYILARGFHE